MIDHILEIYHKSTYDFRKYACTQDPLIDLFDQWVPYYRMKHAIASVLAPNTILEIGVRYGYSCRAFLEANQKAKLVGIDADSPTFGGESGAVAWAEASLSDFNVTIFRQSSQNLSRLPGHFYDLVHVDGQQDGDGTFHDLELAVHQARYILVNGYFWTDTNFRAVNEWIWLNKAAVESIFVIPGYAGEFLIKTKSSASGHYGSSLQLKQAYTADYYLSDCGGYKEWQKGKGKTLDLRLQAVADIGMVVSAPANVVDLGAGRGELTRFFAHQGAMVKAVDYSANAEKLIEETLGSEESLRKRVAIVCDSVLNPDVYNENYDLAVASDIIEHLSPDEDETLYALVSGSLKAKNGVFVLHTAPNQWCYRYEHPRQQTAAKQAGCWLPRTRRTYYERLMHINEQNPRILKKQLSRHFPYVLLWFVDNRGMGGSLLQHFRVKDLRCATSLFAVASHRPIDRETIADVFRMRPLTEYEADTIKLSIGNIPEHVDSGQEFVVSVELVNPTDRRLASLMPHPFHISYHWFDETGNPVIYDGVRTPLNPPLSPQTQSRYNVRVKSPDRPGRYKLHIAPVQELVRWHENANPDNASITVVGNEFYPTTVFECLTGFNLSQHGRRVLFGSNGRPIMLIVETVNICNNNCLVCAYGQMKRQKQCMEMSVFRKTIEDYIAMGGGALSLTPVVGDILLDKYLIDRIALLRNYRTMVGPVSVTTNLIETERYSDDELIAIFATFNKIHISIYGLTDEDYCTLARKNNYRKLINSLNRLRQLNLTGNLTFGFRLLHNHSDQELKAWILRNVGVEVPFDKTTSYANWGVFDTNKKLPFDASWIQNPQKTMPCLIPLVAMQVFVDGNVSFCPCDDFDNDPSLHIGDVKKDTLIDIYNSSRTKMLWKFDPVPSFCEQCSFYRPITELSHREWIFDNPLGFIGG